MVARALLVERMEPRRLLASIGGFVWTETDGDGVYESGESLLKDKTVFIDSNRNGKMDASEPRKITDAQGKYRFDNLTAGTYKVGRERPNGYWFTSPLSGFHDIVLGGTNVTNANIGTANRPPATTPTTPPTTPTNPTPAPTGAVLQAELAALSGGTSKQSAHAGYTGTGFADFGGQGSALQFTIQRTDAGVVELQFRYANGSTGNRPLQILVNGSLVGTLSFGPTGAWNKWSTTTLAGVALPAGTVTIRAVASTSAGGANVDAMTIVAPGNPVDPTPPPTPTPSGTLSWTTGANMPQGKAEAFGGAIGGKLYVFGGYIDNTFKPTTSAHVFNPANNTWSAIASLPMGVSHAATAFDSRYMYFVGGYPATATAQSFATNKAYRYDSVTNTYAALPDLPAARGAAAGAIANGVLYVVGGCDSSRNDRAEMWALDLGNLAAGWVQKASLPQARNHEAALGVGGFVHVFGGDTGHDDEAVKNATHWRYNPANNTWETLAPLPSGRSHITNSVLVHNGAIVSLGGEGDDEAKLSRVDRYDPTTNAWTALTALPSPRFSAVGDLIDGKIYLAGGYNSTFEKTTFVGTFA